MQTQLVTVNRSAAAQYTMKAEKSVRDDPCALLEALTS
jgi:hypothetical protein